MRQSLRYLIIASTLLWPAIGHSQATDRVCALESNQDWNTVIADCTALIPAESDPFRLAEYYYARCYAYMRNADYDRALADCNEAIRRIPAPWGIGMRGQIYDKMGDYDRALADIEQSLVDEFVAFGYANNATGLAARGDVFRHKGDYDRAVRDYDNAIALVTDGIDNLRPKSLARMYSNRALARQAKGDILGAEADLDEANRNDRLIQCPFTPQYVLPEDCPYNR